MFHSTLNSQLSQQNHKICIFQRFTANIQLYTLEPTNNNILWALGIAESQQCKKNISILNFETTDNASLYPNIYILLWSKIKS